MRMMMIGALFLAVTWPLAAAVDAPRRASVELATVNGETVTTQDLLDAFTNRHSGHAKFLGGAAEARRFLEILINERLLIQEAFNIGLDQDPALQKKVEEYATGKANDALMKREIDEKAKPTEDEIKTAWAQLNFVIQGREVAVETRQEAEEVRAALLRSGDVEAIARSCSRAESRTHGGVFVASWGQRAPEWENVVFGLKEGEISPVIESQDGYEVVAVDVRYDVPQPELAKIREDLTSVASQRKLERRKLEFAGELWTKYHAKLQPIDETPSAMLKMIATAPDTVVATWDGDGKLTIKDAITSDDLKMLRQAPPVRGRKEVDSRVRATVNDPLVTLEAKARKLAEDPEVARVVNRYRQLLVQDALFREHIWKNVTVSDGDVTKYYETHKGDFIAPEQRHVAQILVPTEKEAKAVRAQIAGGGAFDEMAKKVSRDIASAQSAGDLGWITADKVPPNFKDVLTLKPGGVSQPLRSPAGWHLIKLLEVKPAHQMAFAEVKAQASQKALDAKQREAQKFWLDKLRAAAKIEVRDAAIKQFVQENHWNGEAPPQHAPKM